MSELPNAERCQSRGQSNRDGKQEPVLMFEGIDRTPIPLKITLCKPKSECFGEFKTRVQVPRTPTPLVNNAAGTQPTVDKGKLHPSESAEVFPESELDDLCIDVDQIKERYLKREMLHSKGLDRKIKSPEPPPRVVLVLRETDTIFLLERPSLTEIKGTPEGDEAEKDNEYYEYITTGKGSLHYKSNAEVQTAYSVLKNKSSMASPCETRDTSVSASSWDMYKTYEEVHWG